MATKSNAKKNSTSPATKGKASVKPKAQKPDKAPVTTAVAEGEIETPAPTATQDNEPSPTTTEAQPLTVQTSTGKRLVVRAVIFRHPVTSVLRRLGAEGFDFTRARQAINHFGAAGISDTTVRIQIAAGRKGQRGEPAALTEDQLKELEAAAN
jgi:hypothetical protein